MCMMDFHDWFREKYKGWSGGKKSVNQFAIFLEISQPTVNAWISGTRNQPTTRAIINKLVEKFGPDEVFQALGLKEANNYIQVNRPRNIVKEVGVLIPLLGRIAAGSAVPMPKQDFPAYGSDSAIQVIRDWLPPHTNITQLFALEVEGDSMIEEGIRDGDTIVMSKSHTAENGDLVAVRIDDDDSVTLKKFFRDNGTVILQPANRELKPIVVPAEKVHIEGKIVISIRKWK